VVHTCTYMYVACGNKLHVFITYMYITDEIVKCDQMWNLKNRSQAQWARRRVWTFRWCNVEGPTPVRSRPFAIPRARVPHSAHTKVQLYRFARRAVLVHTIATSSLMYHVITRGGDVSHRSGKDMRKKRWRMAADGYFLCCIYMGANIRDAMADLYRPF